MTRKPLYLAAGAVLAVVTVAGAVLTSSDPAYCQAAPKSQLQTSQTKQSFREDIVPIFWDDNYFSLLPGEERSLSATFDSSDYDRKDAVLQVNGFNIQPVTIKLK